MMEDNFDEIWDIREERDTFIEYICPSCNFIDKVPTFVYNEEMDFLKFYGESNKSEVEFQCPECGNTMKRKS